MIAVDTNILARFYCDDPHDPEAARQQSVAKRVMVESDAIFVPLTVILEFDWVMRGFYEAEPTPFSDATSHLFTVYPPESRVLARWCHSCAIGGRYHQSRSVPTVKHGENYVNANVSVASLRMPPLAHADAAHYAEYGYVVVREVLPRSLINNLLTLYGEQIVPSRYPFFRQNSNRYEANKFSAQGYVKQSFLDIHDYRRYAQFSDAAREIFCTPGMMAALGRVTGFDSFALMQTMLFDQNTETAAHQDWYYLDSVPSGNLIAAWIALEDIDERAGRFYVLPASHREDFGANVPGRTHEQWLALIKAYVDAHRKEISAPALQAGDVLFWNSRTVHGSLPTRDAAFSRKSLTAHYLPTGFEFGNLFSAKPNISYKEHQGIRFYRNQPDFSPWNRIKFAVKTRAYNYPMLRETLRAARNAVTQRRGKNS